MLLSQTRVQGLLSRPLVRSAVGTAGLSYAARRPLCALPRAGSVVGRNSSILAAVRTKSRLSQRAEQPSQMPKALVFQCMGLSTLRSAQGLIRRADPASGGEPKEKEKVEVLGTSSSTKVEPKKTLMEKIKHEALHYWHGTKLFAKEVKLSSKLVSKVVWGGKLTRREQRQLRRTFTDTVRLVPFLLFVVIPFAELLLPVALKLFPNMLPSTYEDKAAAEKKRVKMQKVRNEMSRYLKETIAEMSRQRSEAKEVPGVVQSTSFGELAEGSVEDTSEFLDKIRSSSEKVSTSDLVRVAHIFEDELTLDNLSRPQLVSICRFMGVNAFGTDNYLRYQITNRMRYIRADDKVICGEGIDSLSVPELQSACQSRGIRIIGVSPGRMREELGQWIELHLEHNIPSTLLILSRILAAGEPMAPQQQQQFNADALQATINSLPDNLVNEATLRLAEVSGKATPKQKLEVLEEQEELIEDEDEQEKKRQSREAAESKGKAEEDRSASKDSDATVLKH